MELNQKVIEIFKKVHGDLYDYSLVNYINNVTKVKIICKEHGIFEQTPHNHKRGGGCPKCGVKKIGVKRRLSNEDYINKCIRKHGDLYDYSLVNYDGNRRKVKIICKKHGVFEQNAASHMNGASCPKCNLKNLKRSDLIDRFLDKHKNKYKYYLDDDKYGTSDIINIECDEHGIFQQKISNHLSGSGCQKCAGKIFSFDDFKKRASDVHDDKYDYSEVDYKKFDIPVKILCKKHGFFEQKPVSHFMGRGCPVCRESKGEIAIRSFLNKNKIDFIPQKKFKDCFYIRNLPFDFYLPSYNVCIEFNGRQHYEPVIAFGGETEFDEIKKRDLIKKEFCHNSKIKLLVISYKNFNSINEILSNFLFDESTLKT